MLFNHDIAKLKSFVQTKAVLRSSKLRRLVCVVSKSLIVAGKKLLLNLVDIVLSPPIPPCPWSYWNHSVTRVCVCVYILHCTPVEINSICVHTIFPQPSQEVEVLMNFLCDGINVLDPWQIFRNMHARKHETVDSSHRWRQVHDICPPEVKNRFLGLANIEVKVFEIVILVPYNQIFNPCTLTQRYPLYVQKQWYHWRI